MTYKIQSHVLKILILIFMVASLFLGYYILPMIAEEGASNFPEMLHLKTPLLVGSQLMVFMFIVGLGLIIYLLILFDQNRVFSPNFTKTLNLLAILCFLASIGVLIILLVLGAFGGPGPGLLFLLPLLLTIIIVGNAFMFFAKVINEAILYKQENDLTV